MKSQTTDARAAFLPLQGGQSSAPRLSGQLGSLLLLLLAGFLCCCKSGSGESADKEHQRAALQRLATAIDDEMAATESVATRLAADVAEAYKDVVEKAATVDPGNYRLESNGVLHRPDAVKADVPAVFVSGAVAVDDRILTIVKGTESIDPHLKELVAGSNVVVQCYYNDRNSYNRIYPPFDVLTQYPPGMPIPEYNFYYLADAKHNPERRATWVRDPYVDPAGRGWMISCLAPVYAGDELEGVCGLDITVEALVRGLDLEGTNNFFLLLSNDGTVVAAGETMSRILRLPNLKSHRYVDTVRSDTLRTDDYNLGKSSSNSIREMNREITVNHMEETILDLDGKKWRVRSAPVARLDWHVLEFRPLP